MITATETSPETRAVETSARSEFLGTPDSSTRTSAPSVADLNPENPVNPVPARFTARQLQEGRRRLTHILQARELKASGHSWEQIETACGVDSSTLIRWLNNVSAIASADLTAQLCAPQNHKAGRPPKHKLTPAQAAALKAIALPINRNYADTSLPEAVRRGIAAGIVPQELAAEILAREQRGQPLLTDALRGQLHLTPTEVQAYRQPRNAWLDNVASHGALMLTRDEETGEERFFQPGEAYTIDDGSINLGCCVPMERPGDKCWENFGVIVGRFQFIPVVDHRTRAILGFNFTARPRDSYRAEDLTATMQTIFAEHGIPRRMFLEHGVSDSRLVNDTLKLLGVVADHVHSPHEKVIEKMFDLLWTKLSALPGQVGRYMGEMEAENKILQACKRGEKDPRRHFPALPDVLKAMRQAIAELNQQWMNSPQYGRWQPGPWFDREAHKVTRRLNPADAWMFSPVITRPLKVRGFCVGASAPIMPGFSLKFHFGAEFLARHAGDEVILHFNPFAPECVAMVVHAASGQVLGPAEQINRHARFTRRAFGYGLDPDIGHAAARKHAQALHRTVAAIKAGGQVGAASAESRDGLGNLVKADVGASRTGDRFEANSTPKASVSADPAANAQARATLSRLTAISNQLRADDTL